MALVSKDVIDHVREHRDRTFTHTHYPSSYNGRNPSRCHYGYRFGGYQHGFMRQYVTMTRVCDLDFKTYRPGRGGVIVYTVRNGQFLFGMGRDVPSRDLTDFGGGIQKTDPTSLSGSLREFAEESQSVFGSITPEMVQNSWVIHNYSMMIVFIRVECDLRLLDLCFRDKLRTVFRPEVSEIVWLTADKLGDLVAEITTDEKIYSRVRNLLGRVGVPKILAKLAVE